MFSLSDRLKGLATQIEATGSQLQAKAIGQNQQPSNPSASGSSSSTALETSSSPRPASPKVTTKSNSITSPITSPTGGSQLGASPTRTLSGNYATSTSALAENALSGLRKSFNFANRQSSPLHDSQAQPQAQGQSQSQNQSSGQHAPSGSSSSINNTASSQPQELKDIPSSPKPANGDKSDSRPGSPAKGLTGGHFQLGSDPSSLMATPVIPRSPNLAHPSPLPLRSHSPLAFARSASPSSSRRPTPNPEEPATFPLPPSPIVSPTSLHVPTPLASATTQYSDPLGASPLLPPTKQEVPEEKLDVGKSSIEEKDEAVIPALDIEEPTPTGPTPTDEKSTPDADKEMAAATEALELVDKQSTADLDAISVTALETAAEEAPRPSVEMPAPATPAAGGPDADLEKQLAAAERRYENLSNRFTTLLTQKHNADKVLREFTPLEGGIQDHEALEGWVRMMKGKVDMITEEMKRLQGKISLQESRIEELRDTHRLEGSSQTELITKLRAQLATAEKNLESKGNDLIATSTLRSDLAKAQTAAKDEEEKRTKAISLLKTVRLKLVKVEKEKEEVERDRAEERAERSHAKEELEKLKTDREREVSNLRKGFEKELSSAREKFEKELQAKKAAWELEMITTKASHAKELSGKSTKVNGLESIVKELSSVKQKQFEELESRQAEVESSRAEMEGLRNRTKELEFQLRESNERLVLLEDSGRDEETQGPSATSSVEIQRMLAEAEARAEVRLSDLRNKIRLLENERNDNEEDWARKLSERVRELEKLRRVIQEKETEYNDSIRSREDKERLIEEGRAAREEVEREVKRLKGEVEAAKGDVEVAIEAERAARADLASVQADLAALQAQLDESKSYGDKLKNNNKTLREEMRKIQSSVQLMEKQRNPGVGYWSSSNPSGAGVSRSSITSPEPSTPLREGRPSMESSRTAFSAATQSANGASTGMSTPTDKDNKEEEEVNLEYLRNVILQFLEHREMRPNLVRVLSVILRFTPQELRRLNAKLLS